MGADDRLSSFGWSLCTSLDGVSVSAIFLEGAASRHPRSIRRCNRVVGANCGALSWRPVRAVEFVTRASIRISAGGTERAFGAPCGCQCRACHCGDNHDLGFVDADGASWGHHRDAKCHGSQHEHLSRARFSVLPALLFFRRALSCLHGNCRNSACGPSSSNSAPGNPASNLRHRDLRIRFSSCFWPVPATRARLCFEQ